MMKEMICVSCPVGCSIKIELSENNDVLSVTGNHCKRGENYAITECTAPTRMLTTTVKVKNGVYPLVPVRSEKPVPKHMLFDIIKLLNSIEMTAPVKIGDIIINNVLGTDVDIIATNICSKN